MNGLGMDEKRKIELDRERERNTVERGERVKKSKERRNRRRRRENDKMVHRRFGVTHREGADRTRLKTQTESSWQSRAQCIERVFVCVCM